MVETSTGHDDYSQQLQQHLRTVLRNKATGKNNSEYLGLLQEVTALKAAAFVGGNEAAQHDLCSLLDIMTACISALHEQRHSSLISEIFSISMWDAVKELRASVLCFMLHLAVVSSTMTLQILQVLVLNLGLPWALAAQQADVLGEEWHPLPKAEDVQADIIATLEKVLELVPVSGSLLLPILARGVPNKVVSRSIQCTYLRGMLIIAELPRAAPLRKQILAAIVQHLVSLDVEIRWQDIAFSLDEKDEDGGENEEEEVEKDDQEDIFELEGAREELQLDPSKFQDQILDSATQGSDPGNRVTGRSGFEGKATDEPPSTSGREQPFDETAEKLDSMMTQVFQHISKCRQNGHLATTWQAILESFFTTVLNTHRSKFTQYLLWYILELDGEKSRREFLGKLLQVLADSRQPAITRSAAASYVSSFLARAAFLSDSILVDHISRLAGWCLAYCQRFDAEIRTEADPGREYREAPPIGVVHQVFYAACQGLLYVSCYRLEQLVESQEVGARDEIRNLFQHSIPLLLQSRLAPMAICLPTVVTEFTKLTARLGLMNCQAHLPGNAEASKSQRPLEMFFPFDPYLLRRSATFLDLHRTFLRWRGGSSEAQEDAAEENSENDNGSDMSSEADLDDSGSSSSGLKSGSDDDGSEAGSDKEELTDAFRALTPEDYSPVAVWKTVSQPIKAREPSPMPESYSTNSNSSPAYPMSWTAGPPQNPARRRQPFVGPLDTSK